EEPVQHREARREVEVLPDVALQQRRVVGETVDDFGGGQPVVAELASEAAHRGDPLGLVRGFRAVPPKTILPAPSFDSQCQYSMNPEAYQPAADSAASS